MTTARAAAGGSPLTLSSYRLSTQLLLSPVGSAESSSLSSASSSSALPSLGAVNVALASLVVLQRRFAVECRAVLGLSSAVAALQPRHFDASEAAGAVGKAVADAPPTDSASPPQRGQRALEQVQRVYAITEGAFKSALPPPLLTDELHAPTADLIPPSPCVLPLPASSAAATAFQCGRDGVLLVLNAPTECWGFLTSRVQAQLRQCEEQLEQMVASHTHQLSCSLMPYSLSHCSAV